MDERLLFEAGKWVIGIVGAAVAAWYALKGQAEKAGVAAAAADNRAGVAHTRIDKLEEAVNGMNREIGEVKASAAAAIAAEQHRIDEHAARGAKQQTQNAEFFAQETREAMLRAEALVAKLEKATRLEKVSA